MRKTTSSVCGSSGTGYFAPFLSFSISRGSRASRVKSECNATCKIKNHGTHCESLFRERFTTIGPDTFSNAFHETCGFLRIIRVKGLCRERLDISDFVVAEFWPAERVRVLAADSLVHEPNLPPSILSSASSCDHSGARGATHELLMFSRTETHPV